MANAPFFQAPSVPLQYQTMQLGMTPQMQTGGFDPYSVLYGLLNKNYTKNDVGADTGATHTSSAQQSADVDTSKKLSSLAHKTGATTTSEPVSESKMLAADKFAANQPQNKNTYDALLNYKAGLNAVNNMPVNDVSWTNPIASFLNSAYGTKLAPVSPQFSAKDKLQSLLEYANGQTNASKDYANQLLEYDKARGLQPTVTTTSEGVQTQNDTSNAERNANAQNVSDSAYGKNSKLNTNYKENTVKPMLPRGSMAGPGYDKWVPQWNQVRKDAEKSIGAIDKLKKLAAQGDYGALKTSSNAILAELEGRRLAANGNQSLMDQSAEEQIKQFVEKYKNNDMTSTNKDMINADIDAIRSAVNSTYNENVKSIKGQYDNQVGPTRGQTGFLDTVKTALTGKQKAAYDTIKGNHTPEEKQRAMQYLQQEGLINEQGF